MSSKRKRQIDIGDDDEASSSYQTSARLDPTYGQRSAFPGLDTNSDPSHNLETGAEEDGLSYLRKVRAEARKVPNLLVAPREHTTDSQDLYANRGWYSDGAYTGAPNSNLGAKSDKQRNGLTEEEEEEEDDNDLDDILEDGEVDEEEEAEQEEDEKLDAQEAYYAALLERFAVFRTALLTQPPTFKARSQARSTLPEYQATDLKSKKYQWSRVLRFSTPTAGHISSLSQRDVMRGLERLEVLLPQRKNLLGSSGQGEFLGAWAWALLARCRSIGEIGSEDVATIRSLGKTAASLKATIRQRTLNERAPGELESWAEDEKDSQGVEDRYEGVDEDIDMDNAQDDMSRLPKVGNGAHICGTNEEKVEEAPNEKVTQQELNENGDNAEDRIQLKLAKRRAMLLCAVSGASSNLLGPSSGDLPDQHSTIETELVESDSTSGVSLPCSNSSRSKNGGKEADVKELEERAFATLDIIITIVGEVFGQRDLLDAREVWGEFD